eukprot:Hpha_TRINITY_DN15950_c1_g11::TRINITY_DN15950_c1_g11_i1::g.70714::m.70714/K01136/IDS; iduronate 2-sulfatase
MRAAHILLLLSVQSAAAHAEPTVPPPKRNLLYIVFDDLRPDLSAYDVPFMKTPNIQKLADSGLMFERAYCQQSVCSPSRNSFTTGRRPNSTKVWNFINHFRNAECPDSRNAMKALGTTMEGGWTSKPGGWSQTTTGGFAQCCSSCSSSPGCAGWTYNRNNCTLYSEVTGWAECPNGQPTESIETCISGTRGTFPTWTPLPANFRDNGYMTLGVGKYYHPGGHSAGGAPGDIAHPAGPGTPPLADRDMSWTPAGPNGTMQFPDQRIYQAKWGTFHSGEFGPYGNFQYLNPDDEACNDADYCTVPWPADGTPPSPPTKGQMALGDFVTYKDAKTKMQFAAANRQKTGQPFFLVVGVKRPHLKWRIPQSYADMYPAEDCAVPTQLTLDKSIDPVAYTVFPMQVNKSGDFVKSPYVHGTDADLKELRRHYYAAVSWADYVTGQVLDELDDLSLTKDTMVVLHSDHGWHLGEYAMWEKRTNWELGTRVPLIIRVPWIDGASSGKRTKALVELVDLYKTVCDVMGVQLPDDTVPIDGVSLKPVLEDPTRTVKDVALSAFPRCAHEGMPVYGQRGLPGGADNSCLEVERTDFTWMGYTMRTDQYRYTEWVRWNGTDLTPIWSDIKATELYNHTLDTGAWTNPDSFENVNLVTSTDKTLIAALSKQLHAAFGFPDA